MNFCKAALYLSSLIIISHSLAAADGSGPMPAKIGPALSAAALVTSVSYSITTATKEQREKQLLRHLHMHEYEPHVQQLERYMETQPVLSEEAFLAGTIAVGNPQLFGYTMKLSRIYPLPLLHYAIVNAPQDDPDMLTPFFELGLPLDTICREAATPLFSAVENNRPRMAVALLAQPKNLQIGYSPSRTASYDYTRSAVNDALKLAVWRSQTAVVAAICARPDGKELIRNHDHYHTGTTAFTLLASSKRKHVSDEQDLIMAQHLVEAGINPTILSSKFTCAFEEAIDARRSKALINFLIKADCDWRKRHPERSADYSIIPLPVSSVRELFMATSLDQDWRTITKKIHKHVKFQEAKP